MFSARFRQRLLRQRLCLLHNNHFCLWRQNQTVVSYPHIFRTKKLNVWKNLPDDLSMALTRFTKLSRPKFEIVISQELKGRLTWCEGDASRSCMTIASTLVFPWWFVWMYLIVAGVVSGIGIPSIHIWRTTEHYIYSYHRLLTTNKG